MPRFGINFIGDVYFVVDADDEDEAVDVAYELLYSSRMSEFDWAVDEVDTYDEDDPVLDSRDYDFEEEEDLF